MIACFIIAFSQRNAFIIKQKVRQLASKAVITSIASQTRSRAQCAGKVRAYVCRGIALKCASNIIKISSCATQASADIKATFTRRNALCTSQVY